MKKVKEELVNNSVDKFNKNYYQHKFRQFGDTPKGVDWKDRESQFCSFKYIINAIRFYYPDLSSSSILEVGCGYGAFFEFLQEQKIDADINYFGIDLVPEMIQKAIEKYPKLKNNLYTGEFKSFKFKQQFDFTVSSGIFNVKEHIEDSVYEKSILNTIQLMFNISEKGTVFNLMTPAPDYKDAKLFYPSLDTFFSFIYKKMTRKITVISSFPLWKITIGIFK